MKPRYLLLCLLPLFCQLSVTAQSLAINTDGSTANASAILDVKSTTKGILIPRMSKIERNSIASPATGLMVFQASPDSIGFYYYNASSWSWVSSSTNGSDWKLTGNFGTDTATNFIGTTDNMALRFKVNNQQAGLISSNNNLIGLNAGKSAGTSTGLVAMGVGALGLNKNKNNLVAIGDSALYNNSTSSPVSLFSTDNSAFGTKALLNNTTGFRNTATGFQAMYSCKNGVQNTANGDQALYSNVDGGDNTAVGYQSLYSNLGNLSGGDNTAVGYQAMFGNITGAFNTAIGNQALSLGSTGQYNVAVGESCLSHNTGDANTSIGFVSMFSNSSGSYNTAIGCAALLNSGTGSNNIAIGNNALYNGSYLGSYNTGIGDSVNILGINTTNATAIGAKAEINCSNCLVLGSVKGSNNSASNVNVGIGTTSPDALLEVKSGAVLFDSTIGSTPASGAGTRMMWIPAKASFRAGAVTGTEWDDANIGFYSSAFGFHAIASGYSSIVMGTNTASGDYSTAIGYGTIASGTHSTAMGFDTKASAYYAIAMGNNTSATADVSTATGTSTVASGYHSFAAGLLTRSKSFAGFTIGVYNDSTNAVDPSNLNSLNRIFQIGNGTADNARSNAMTVLQNGDVGIGTVSPAYTLDVNGTTTTNGLQVGNGTIITKMQSGSLTVGPNATGQLIYVITFPVAFATGTPRVFITARNEPATSYGDSFSVSVRAITANSVTLNIQRTDSNSGWAQQLRLDWFAVE